MKRCFILSFLSLLITVSSFAKKDTEAWKTEPNLKQQYIVFKENLNFWQGNYFLDEKQLNEFYSSLTDSIGALKSEIETKMSTVNSLQDELDATQKQLNDTKVELEESVKNQNAIDVFGMHLEKTIYTLIMSLLILGLLVFLGVVYLLFSRSNKITVKTKRDYEELKTEFEAHKKSSLDRYTKINMELHRTRMEMRKG